LFWWGCE